MRRAFGRLLRNFDIYHLQIREGVAKHGRFFTAEVAAGFFLNHRQLIDEHFRELEIHFALARFWIGNLTEEKCGVLRVHHYELDEALGKLAALGAGLDFSHGSLLFRNWRPLWRSHRS